APSMSFWKVYAQLLWRLAKTMEHLSEHAYCLVGATLCVESSGEQDAPLPDNVLVPGRFKYR
ncbi:MAG TPA: hypothetical protein VM822_05205, partial [Pseudolabrys sp.]|nr:hypothetical protein [Pseudolabrys sp.]